MRAAARSWIPAALNFPAESVILKVERRAGWVIAPPGSFSRAGRKVRTPQGSVLANGQDRSGLFRWDRHSCLSFREGSGRYGQCHRKYTASRKRGKGEKVRSRRTGLNVRAHRPDGDVRGRENPTRSKTK